MTFRLQAGSLGTTTESRGRGLSFSGGKPVHWKRWDDAIECREFVPVHSVGRSWISYLNATVAATSTYSWLYLKFLKFLRPEKCLHWLRDDVCCTKSNVWFNFMMTIVFTYIQATFRVKSKPIEIKNLKVARIWFQDDLLLIQVRTDGVKSLFTFWFLLKDWVSSLKNKCCDRYSAEKIDLRIISVMIENVHS